MRQLSIVSAVTKFMPDFWTRDSDMMSVALMSDVAGSRHPTDGDSSGASKLRVGQLILAVELAERLQATRQVKDLAVVSYWRCFVPFASLTHS